jgi:hypothetical protein
MGIRSLAAELLPAALAGAAGRIAAAHRRGPKASSFAALTDKLTT